MHVGGVSYYMGFAVQIKLKCICSSRAMWKGQLKTAAESLVETDCKA